MHSLYSGLILRLDDALGSRRATARQLGVSHNTVTRRLSDPNKIRNEHILAAGALLARIER